MTEAVKNNRARRRGIRPRRSTSAVIHKSAEVGEVDSSAVLWRHGGCTSGKEVRPWRPWTRNSGRSRRSHVRTLFIRPGRRDTSTDRVVGPPAPNDRRVSCAVSTSTRSRMSDHNPAPAPAAVATELAGYPQHWEADVVLVDGGVVHLRPSGAGDGAAIRAMHGRMSARTLFLRYFTPLTEVTDEQVASFTDTDYVSRVGLVAELGGEVIAAGTYHRNSTGDTDAAEVAFVVEDSQQRRGLGSILLEHLAAAAQERGIRRFTAEVLSENRQMVKVFIDAGYQVNREYGSGIVDLVFDIEPTEKSRAVVTSREHRAESRSIARLLSPRSIAVIGASREPTKIGHAVLLNLLRGAFTGAVYPVHPEAGSVQGVHAYGSVLDIPEPVDLAVVTVPAARVAEVVQSCGAKGVHGLVVMTGFSDDQIDGPEARRTMVSAARAAGMRIVGPSCLGVVNTDPRVRMNASLAPVVPPPGRIGFFCQSGALGVAILADAAARGLGLSTFVSAGDRADVSGNDLLQFWHGDDRTEVVLLYLESFGNPRKFARLARVLGKTKPVIAVKSGRHARTTVGLAGNQLDDAVVGTLFEQSGVIRTPGLTDAFDVAQLLSTQPVPAGNRVGIVGNSKALGVLAVDFCLDAGLQVTDDAPTDLGVTVSAEAFGTAVHQAMARPDVDALVVAWVPPVAIPGTAHAAALRDAVAGATKPVVTTFLAVDGLVDHLAVRDSGGHPGRGSVPAYGTLERAVSALSHAVRYGAWLSRPAGEVPVLTGVDPAAARAAVDRMRNAGDPERATHRRRTGDTVVVLRDLVAASSNDPRGRGGGRGRRGDRLPGDAQVIRPVDTAPYRSVRGATGTDERRPGRGGLRRPDARSPVRHCMCRRWPHEIMPKCRRYSASPPTHPSAR